jgi:hypothetical protein
VLGFRLRIEAQSHQVISSIKSFEKSGKGELRMATPLSA